MKKKILIADDSMFMRKMIENILSSKYEIIQADSGATTLELFEKEKPDLTLLDIVMPDRDEEGVEVLKKIMKDHSEAKVVMVTAVGQDAVIKECKKLGAIDYITKPFDEQKVIETVEKYLSQVSKL